MVISTRTKVGVALTVVNIIGFIVLFLFVVTSMMLLTALLLVASFVMALFILFLCFKIVVIIGEIIYVHNVPVGITISVLLLPCWDTFLEGHEELVVTEPFIERGWEIW